MADGKKRKFIKELQTKPRLRRESGLYIVDGARMCAELPPEETEEIYVTEAFLASPHRALCSGLLQNRGCQIVTEQEMKQMSDTVTPQGILAVARQKRVRGLADFLRAGGSNPLYLILESVRDPGNLGTMFRTAEAAGAAGILMDRECADAYAPKVVRSTMGAIFRVPFLVVEDLCRAAETLKRGTDGSTPVRLYAAHLRSAEDYTRVSYREGAAVMIGNEARGLSDALTACADAAVKIPMCGNVESLNAAMAATIILFEAARQRRNTGYGD